MGKDIHRLQRPLRPRMDFETSRCISNPGLNGFGIVYKNKMNV